MRFLGSKNREQIEETSFKKLRQDGDSSWHRLLMDFRRFCGASWN